MSEIPEIALPAVDWPLVEAIQRVSVGAAQSLPRRRHSLGRDTIERIQRARILVATADEVVERGYAATSVTSIGRRANVSSKTFYAYYDGKEQAFLDLYLIEEAALVRFAERLATVTDTAALPQAIVHSYLEVLTIAPRIARVLVMDAQGATPGTARRRIQALHEFSSVIAAAYRRSSGGRIIETHFVTALVITANDLMYRHLLLGADTLEELESAMTAIAARLLRQPEN
ncbi:TetR/AcrR family transcriptional regulator [Mycobacterium sp. 1274756.6]|uniref:TetR/AcrR family transcriptional regulator n=1 Tax=Mycobacterium sp. 1274756.6 TaxID=1834076 RepID=UPI0007FCB61A|nr:TetR/AcrR family transcriptional regulator [Mycobacterium sp. 1274756.6]OBJ70565.1 hypothetical protein A5643_09200 [Mycobacterium sp. 1274756.6]